MGVLKLKDKGQRVEVRVVLHAITAPRIAATCRWFARNLPFVDHVALMGLENTGFAIANDELRGGPGCLNNFSASISGASAGVKLPSGATAG